MNTLVVGTDEVESTKNIAQTDNGKSYALKNISGEHTVFRVTAFHSIQEAIKDKNYILLSFFRSDDDVIFLLKTCTDLNLSFHKKMEIAAELKKISISECKPELIHAWMQTVQSLDRNWQGQERLLSSLIIVAKNLIPRKQWTSDLTQFLKSLNVNHDGRTNSDVIEVASEKLSQPEFDQLEDELLTPRDGYSYRAQGNLLIARAQHGLSDDITRDIGKLLASRHPNQIATGIFCASRIIQKYRRENPVLLSQFLEFQNFIQQISKYANHSDSMVRSRATLEFHALNQKDI